MKILLSTLLLLFLSGCASTTTTLLQKKEIDRHMNNQPTLSTPRDGLMIANLNCFSDFNQDGLYQETVSYSYQGFLSEGIYAENYFIWDKERLEKESIDDVDDLTQKDAEGLVFEYFFEEDINGEYIASMTLNKRTFVKNLKSLNKKDNAFKLIDYKKDYYPQNKHPMRVFEDQNEMCYVTVSW